MRMSTPRISALEPDQWDEDARSIMQPFVDSGRDFNIFRTLVNHPQLTQKWLGFATHVLMTSTLPDRDRELLILRIGHLCNAQYEFRKHSDISRNLGMSEQDIESAKTGPDTEGISELDKLLLTATDELHEDAHISDTTWQALTQHYSTQQMMDLVFTVGQYNMVSMVLNSFGVQHDEK